MKSTTSGQQPTSAASGLPAEMQALLQHLHAYVEIKRMTRLGKNGRVYGPYYYRYLRWREGGKRRSRHLGQV